MKTLSIRNIPEEVYEQIKKMARVNHRSLQEQVRHLLEQEVRLTTRSPLSEAKSWRSKLAARVLISTVDDVREDRQR